MVALELDDGERDGEAEKQDAEERIDAATRAGAVGGLLAVVVGEDAAAVVPGPEDAHALYGPRVEEAVREVARDDGGIEVGLSPPDEREEEQPRRRPEPRSSA